MAYRTQGDFGNCDRDVSNIIYNDRNSIRSNYSNAENMIDGIEEIKKYFHSVAIWDRQKILDGEKPYGIIGTSCYASGWARTYAHLNHLIYTYEFDTFRGNTLIHQLIIDGLSRDYIKEQLFYTEGKYYNLECKGFNYLNLSIHVLMEEFKTNPLYKTNKIGRRIDIFNLISKKYDESKLTEHKDYESLMYNIQRYDNLERPRYNFGIDSHIFDLEHNEYIVISNEGSGVSRKINCYDIANKNAKSFYIDENNCNFTPLF